MRIELQTLTIRDLEFNDLKQVKEIRDYCLPYLDTQISYSYEETCTWFLNQKPKWYAIDIKNKLIGYIRTSNYDETNKSLYVGLDLHPDFRGYGYAYQSYQTFMEWAKIQGYQTAYLKVQIINTNAYKLYRKLGFLPIGIIPDAIITQNGKIDSVFMYKSL
jgi:ribosomal-protein-alanine N-acetyltransferase